MLHVGVAAAAAGKQLAIVVTASSALSADRASLVETSLLEFLPPTVRGVWALRDDRDLSRRRAQARALLGQASKLVRRVAYGEALPQLEAASRLAVDGLTRLVDPRLLASIHFEKGIALLPSDEHAAKRELLESFVLWPEIAEPRMDEFPPRIEALIRNARQAAAATPAEGLSDAEARNVCMQLGVQRLLAVRLDPTRDGKGEKMTVRLFDAGSRTWQWTETAQWPAGSHTATLPEQLTTAVQSHFTQSQTSQPVGQRRRWPWLAAGGLAVAGAVTATVLGLLASDRASQAEGLARQQPLVPYEPRVADLEAEGRGFERGAIVTWIATAALAATAAIGWFWPRGESRAKPKVSLLLAPGSAGVMVGLNNR